MEYVIGIDEAGRGPLAGPVAVGVVLIPKKFRPSTKYTTLPLRDSKTLPEHAREAWFEYLKIHPDIFYTTAFVHPRTIDRVNIVRATDLAATRAFRRLLKTKHFPKTTKIFIDYGIRPIIRNTEYGIREVVRADERIIAVQLAAIAAKVRRDRYMKKKHTHYPEYHFRRHKGYGTVLHRKAIETHGLCPLHRVSFF